VIRPGEGPRRPLSKLVEVVLEGATTD
jgi:hypothetical protein